MKYSILGFNQSRILSLQKTKNEKIIKLDITDLLILKDVADFMNRSKVIKYTIDDKVFFSVQYATILEDLPILDIKKQALSDRLDKMVYLGVLEKKVIKNQAGTFVAFRMGVEYENLLYSCTSSEILPTSSEIQVQEYQNTTHNTNITNTNNIEKEIDKSISKKKVGNAFNVREDLSYVAEEYVDIWNEWLDYKDEIKKQYKTQRGANSQYKSLVKYANNNPILANAIVKNSIEHSWDGIFALTDKQVELFLSPKSPYYIDKNDEQQTNNQSSEQVIINGQKYR